MLELAKFGVGVAVYTVGLVYTFMKILNKLKDRLTKLETKNESLEKDNLRLVTSNNKNEESIKEVSDKLHDHRSDCQINRKAIENNSKRIHSLGKEHLEPLKVKDEKQDEVINELSTKIAKMEGKNEGK